MEGGRKAGMDEEALGLHVDRHVLAHMLRQML